MEAAHHLQLVVDENGEVQSSEEKCPDCAGYERDLRSLRRQRTLLEQEIGRLQGAEPEADDVRQVLGYWARRVVEEGWWTRSPKFAPGDERWKPVRARLKQGRTVEDCETAVDGALAQGRYTETGKKIPPSWLDATSIFRNNTNFEMHLERLLNPDAQWVRAVQQVPVSLRDRWAEVEELAAICDCSHARLDHQKPGVLLLDMPSLEEPCLVHGCTCIGFDDTMQRADRWIAERVEEQRKGIKITESAEAAITLRRRS